MDNNKTQQDKFSVLLVEDDEVDQMAFKLAVRKEQLPYDYTISSSISEAAALLKTMTFDVVIVDYKLRDGTAFDLVDSLGQTPRIFTTGAGDQEIAIKAMKAGAYDYLVKDLSRNYLKILPGVIRNAINHKKNEDELKEYHNSLERIVRERTDQLAKEKELLSVTLSSMSDAVIAVDVNKKIILFNRIIERLTGISWQQSIGKNVDDYLKIIREDTSQPVENVVDIVLQTTQGQTGSQYDCLFTNNGLLYPVALSAAPICDNTGNCLGVVLILRDVKKEREIEQMKKDFISSVSHELRTPLTSIIAYIDTILSTKNLVEESRKEFLLVIEDESKKLAQLIESILEVSKIESGKSRLTVQDVSILDTITTILTALKPLADKKNISLNLVSPVEQVILKADQSKVESIITNLVNNAIKFTPKNGAVEVSIKLQDSELSISVKDTGIGLPKESLSKIFDRFYRIRRPGQTIQGTGLGLAIVKEFVTMHNGRIEVESEESKGSKFIVILPCQTSGQEPHNSIPPATDLHSEIQN